MSQPQPTPPHPIPPHPTPPHVSSESCVLYMCWYMVSHRAHGGSDLVAHIWNQFECSSPPWKGDRNPKSSSCESRNGCPLATSRRLGDEVAALLVHGPPRDDPEASMTSTFPRVTSPPPQGPSRASGVYTLRVEVLTRVWPRSRSVAGHAWFVAPLDVYSGIGLWLQVPKQATKKVAVSGTRSRSELGRPPIRLAIGGHVLIYLSTGQTWFDLPSLLRSTLEIIPRLEDVKMSKTCCMGEHDEEGTVEEMCAGWVCSKTPQKKATFLHTVQMFVVVLLIICDNWSFMICLLSLKYQHLHHQSP